MAKDVIVVIGAGGIGVAIARRQGFGKTILLADFNEKTLQAAAEDLMGGSYTVSTHHVDVSSRESVRSLVDVAAALGTVVQVVNTAGLSPNMAPPERVLAVDLYGSAVVFEEFERVIAPGGAGLIISSMAGHMLPALPADQDHALAFTPADELLKLPFLSAEAVPEFDDRIYDRQTRQQPSRPGRGDELGRAGRSRQFDKPGDHRDPAGAA